MIANSSVDDDDDFVPLSSVPKRTVRESDEEETERFGSKFVKESSNYNDQALEKLMALVEQYGKTCWVMGFTEGQDGDSKYAEKKSKQLLDDIKEHATPYMAYTAYDGKEEFEESGSGEETEWFDKLGDIKRHFPKDCILDCSSGGRVDDSVDYWVSELNFKVPVDGGLSYVREYGFDDIGLDDVDKYVLWIMCGNIKEEAYEFCRDGSEWDYVDKDAYPEDMDDWGEEDWERFQSEVAVCHLGM